MPASDAHSSSHRFRWIMGLIAAGVVIWVAFFDSHSLLKRYYWHRELDALRQENTQLRADIERLQTQLERPVPDSMVERIAREEYGMKRPGETVYRVNPD